MREHLETELKWALPDPGAYARLDGELERLLGHARRLEQENRFFDSSDARLRRAGLGLRLRRENGRLVVTCKRHVSGGPGATAPETISTARAAQLESRPARGNAAEHDASLHRHQEWEADLDPARWSLALRGAIRAGDLPLPEPVLSALADAPLVPIGGFANLRLERQRGDELICLDRTDFAGRRIDHELEVETETPAESLSFWQERLDAWAVSHVPQARTKLARMLELL